MTCVNTLIQGYTWWKLTSKFHLTRFILPWIVSDMQFTWLIPNVYHLPHNTRLGFFHKLVNRCCVIAVDFTVHMCNVCYMQLLCKQRGSKDDLHFCRNREGHVIGQFAETDNFFLSTRLCKVKKSCQISMHSFFYAFTCVFHVCLTLTSKLVAWAANDSKAAVLVLLIQFFQTSILLGETTLGRDIDNKNHLIWIIRWIKDIVCSKEYSLHCP